MRIIFSVILILLFSAGCKTFDYSAESLNKNIPARYAATADSTAAALISWKKLFFDSTLIQLIDTALVYNYDLREAYQRIEAARANLRLTKGIRLPEVDAVISAGTRKFGDYTIDGVGNYDTKFSTNLNEKQKLPAPAIPDYYTGLQASWEIDLWGKLKNRKKAAIDRFIASQYGKDFVITNLIAEVSTAYFELLALHKLTSVLDENITLQQEAYEIVKIQKEVAKSNELAVELFYAQLLNSKATKALIRQRMVETESMLNFLCGSYPKKIKTDTTYFLKRLHDSLKVGLPSSLLSNRADIKQAEHELRAFNADVKSARAAFYPSFTISSTLAFQAFNALLLFEPASVAYTVFGSLTEPLLNRRKIKAELMNSRAQQKQAYINYEKTMVRSFREVYIGVNNVKNSMEMLYLKSEEAKILKLSITTSKELFKAGRAAYLEVITAQKNALQSQLELIDYYKQQNISVINLYRALGGGWQ